MTGTTGSSRAGRIRRAAAAAAGWIRSAPITYAWLALLLVTTLAQHTLPPDRIDRILDRRSTNLDNLAHHPVRALVGSLFWLDGAYWLPYVVGFTVFLAVAERWLGRWRYLVVGLGGHVVASVISQGLVGAAIVDGRAPAHLATVVDVGVSYFMAAVIGVLTYRIPRPWRWPYLVICLIAFGLPTVVDPVTFTEVGHATALLIGLALYPVAAGRPVADVERLRRRFRQFGATLPTVRHRNS